MIIDNQHTCEKANEIYSRFHDGFIKSIAISSGNKFVQEMPWEKPEEYTSNEARLRDTGLCYFGGKLIKLSVHHYCYDWPNQPWNQVINFYIPRAENISHRILEYVGVDIFDLSFSWADNRIFLKLSIHETPPKVSSVTINDCETETLCSCKRLTIKEKIITSRSAESPRRMGP